MHAVEIDGFAAGDFSAQAALSTILSHTYPDDSTMGEMLPIFVRNFGMHFAIGLYNLQTRRPQRNSNLERRRRTMRGRLEDC